MLLRHRLRRAALHASLRPLRSSRRRLLLRRIAHAVNARHLEPADLRQRPQPRAARHRHARHIRVLRAGEAPLPLPRRLEPDVVLRRVSEDRVHHLQLLLRVGQHLAARHLRRVRLRLVLDLGDERLHVLLARHPPSVLQHGHRLRPAHVRELRRHPQLGPQRHVVRQRAGFHGVPEHRVVVPPILRRPAHPAAHREPAAQDTVGIRPVAVARPREARRRIPCRLAAQPHDVVEPARMQPRERLPVAHAPRRRLTPAAPLRLREVIVRRRHAGGVGILANKHGEVVAPLVVHGEHRIDVGCRLARRRTRRAVAAQNRRVHTREHHRHQLAPLHRLPPFAAQPREAHERRVERLQLLRHHDRNPAALVGDSGPDVHVEPVQAQVLPALHLHFLQADNIDDEAEVLQRAQHLDHLAEVELAGKARDAVHVPAEHDERPPLRLCHVERHSPRRPRVHSFSHKRRRPSNTRLGLRRGRDRAVPLPALTVVPPQASPRERLVRPRPRRRRRRRRRRLRRLHRWRRRARRRPLRCPLRCRRPRPVPPPLPVALRRPRPLQGRVRRRRRARAHPRPPQQAKRPAPPAPRPATAARPPR